jgi:hypothetical protein
MNEQYKQDIQYYIENYQEAFSQRSLSDLENRLKYILGVGDLSIREKCELIKIKNQVGEESIALLKSLRNENITDIEFERCYQDHDLDIMFRWFENLYCIDLMKTIKTRINGYGEISIVLDDEFIREVLNYRDEIQKL